MSLISPCLWFNNQAEEAVAFYCSVFPDSRILTVTRFGKNAPRPEGSVMTIKFQIEGREFFALNGGPGFAFNPSISFVVYCESQMELDEKWEKLSRGGEAGQCGWLRDKYGVSWQIVPRALEKMMSDHDAGKVEAVTGAILKMGKIDLAKLEKAIDGE